MANIARLLKTDAMSSLDLKALAQVLQSKGRKGDTILAHINPKEMMKLAQEGGSGTINPDTGLPEFYSYYDDYGADSYMAGSNYEAPSYQAAPDYTPTQSYSNESDFYTGGGYVPEDYTPQYTQGRTDYTPSYLKDMDVAQYLPQASTGYGVEPVDYASPTNDFLYRGEGTATPLYQGSQAEMAAIQRATNPELAQTGAADASKPDTRSYLKQLTDYIKDKTDLSDETLKKLGIAGVTSLAGLITSNKARDQGQEGKKEMAALAAPYRARGEELTSAAMRGELTPQNQQSLQAAQAKIAQDIQGRGGAGTQQAAMQIENLRQQMIANQYDLGLKVSSIADNVALGAIKTGMQADQLINQANMDFYTQMAQILGGTPSATGSTQPTIIVRR
jgi:hypothetical protein